VYAIPGEEIERRESEILKVAKSLAPRIPFSKTNLLILDEIGKTSAARAWIPKSRAAPAL